MNRCRQTYNFSPSAVMEVCCPDVRFGRLYKTANFSRIHLGLSYIIKYNIPYKIKKILRYEARNCVHIFMVSMCVLFNYSEF